MQILWFFFAVAVLDVLFGLVCGYMNEHSKGGGTRSRYYVCKESNEDVLIFGSSRAKHHYVPDIIEDSLRMTCYNAGEDGNGIIYGYGLLRMITQRYSPKLIVYDVTGYDLYEDDNMKYLDLMKPYYFESGIDSLFWAVEPKTRLMMLSSLYRYNTTCLRVLGNYIRPMTNYPKGYSALYNTMDYDPEIKVKTPGKVDSLKLVYFEKFICLAKKNDINLICCVSPYFGLQLDDSYFGSVKDVCNQYSIPFLNDGVDPDISSDKALFQDISHMNDIGARQYTSKLSHWISSSFVQ